ncbi:hypothetical protein [Xenorhabdus innexi]|uniref:Glycosylphosphatidylinositol diacylglycerol-lyase phosphatidylinositol-specific phospholipase C n=1 Tax=Xenorhabdus innexi TaxID=290109 RepID=A0A1N6MRA2_9GAMM|nr:hypothetical protein [Xenorhabdus innexi]PHM30692.1 glycosylphosphatidylinositol diacylglycerol-lyase phosphatidylinositol-specific phospholipase C [Xenorhabdus innexi]SIP71372.1 hypothetical protein XIS1_1130012 [Xenorhabdus innexi]
MSSIKLANINTTNSVWKRISTTAKNVNINGEFPEYIEPKSTFYIMAALLNNDMKECYFDAKYQIIDSENSTFSIIGEYSHTTNELVVVIFSENLEATNLPKGDKFTLNYLYDNTVFFMLYGDVGNYTILDINSQSWMQDFRHILGDYSINKLCIPGSHDAGMSVATWKTIFAFDCNTLTQSYNIQKQLEFGIRFFDIRPALSDDEFCTCHFSYLGVKWEGATGESISSIINGINNFTKYNNELIILKLSHSLNLDTGIIHSYRPFNENEWLRLFKKLSKIEYLYIHNSINKIPDLTFNQLTDNGTHAAVLIFVDNIPAGFDLGQYYNNGFFHYNSLHVHGKYTNTTDLFKMSEDQIKKMERDAKENYFMLYWTLTQDAIFAGTCSTIDYYSIKSLADRANQYLVSSIYPIMTKKIHPNIIYVDNVKDKLATSLSLAINLMISDK